MEFVTEETVRVHSHSLYIFSRALKYSMKVFENLIVVLSFHGHFNWIFGRNYQTAYKKYFFSLSREKLKNFEEKSCKITLDGCNDSSSKKFVDLSSIREKFAHETDNQEASFMEFGDLNALKFATLTYTR